MGRWTLDDIPWRAFDAAAGAYSRAQSVREYERRALPLYRFGHVRHGLIMALKAVDLNPWGLIGRALTRAAWWFVQTRARRPAAPATA